MRRTWMIASVAFGLAVRVATAAAPGSTQLGPFDETGAPIPLGSIVAVPASSTLYVSGVSNVFRSDDGGVDWVDLGRPGGAYLNQLAVDPSAPRGLYVATNGGVFRTTDAGATWAAAGLQDQAVYALAIDPTSSSTLYAGTWPQTPGGEIAGSIFKSLDAGEHWLQVARPPGDVIVSLAVDPLDPSAVFAGTQGGTVLRSSDAGETWAQVDLGFGAVFQVVPDPVRSGVVYNRWAAIYFYEGSLPVGTVRRSGDGGDTWSTVAGLPTINVGPILFDPNDPTVLYSVADGALRRSSDGGNAWSVLAPAASSSQLAIPAGDPRYLYAAGYGVLRFDLAVLPPHCDASPTTLCLQNGRFAVDVEWQLVPLGPSFHAQAVPLTTESGYFWFFGPNNVELMVKVLDGTAINGHYWVLYGALSDVAYTVTVTDTLTGAQRHYDNPRGTLASVADTDAFPNAVSAGASARPPGPPLPPSPVIVCDPDPTALCLEDGRFQVRVQWQSSDGVSSNATAIPLTGDTGYFWFFNESNVELVVKVLDGRLINGHFWVFYGALSNVQYEITVTDTRTGATQVYENPQGNLASVADTRAF